MARRGKGVSTPGELARTAVTVETTIAMSWTCRDRYIPIQRAAPDRTDQGAEVLGARAGRPRAQLRHYAQAGDDVDGGDQHGRGAEPRVNLARGGGGTAAHRPRRQRAAGEEHGEGTAAAEGQAGRGGQVVG